MTDWNNEVQKARQEFSNSSDDAQVGNGAYRVPSVAEVKARVKQRDDEERYQEWLNDLAQRSDYRAFEHDGIRNEVQALRGQVHPSRPSHTGAMLIALLLLVALFSCIALFPPQ